MLQTRREHRDMTLAVDSPGVAARAALESAVAFTAGRMGADDVVALLKAGNPVAHDYFRYGLARHLADFLASGEDEAKAVYLGTWGGTTDEIESDPVGVTSPLTLIVRVQRKTPRFAALADLLDVEVTRAYAEMLAPAAAGLRGLLDVNVVEEREVDEGSGYGALIISARHKPLRVWPAA